MGSEQEILTGYATVQATDQELESEDTAPEEEHDRDTESEADSLANIAESNLRERRAVTLTRLSSKVLWLVGFIVLLDLVLMAILLFVPQWLPGLSIATVLSLIVPLLTFLHGIIGYLLRLVFVSSKGNKHNL